MRIKFGNVEFFPPTVNYDFMKWRKVNAFIALAMVLASIAVIAVKGINYSIDFLGGAEVTVDVSKEGVGRDDIEKIASEANVGKTEVTSLGAIGAKDAGSYVIRIQREQGQDENATSGRADKIVGALKEKLGDGAVKVASVANISGKIGKEEEYKGYLALLLSFAGILLYVGLRFDSRFAPGGVICLVHDVIVALGVMTLLGKPFTTASIAAFLTIVGYSINDTVIVYDRIRELQELHPRMPMTEVVNKSINQTLNRTALTCATGLAALLVLTFLGGGAIEDFALTMFIGIFVGTYSSIYVAAPFTLMMDGFLEKRGWKREPRQKAKAAKDPNYIPPVMVKKRPAK